MAMALIFAVSISAQTNKFGLKKVDEKALNEIEQISTFPMNKGGSYLKSEGLPKVVDNSLSKFFPNVIMQVGNSCTCVSCVSYIYSYELNCLLNRDGKNEDNVGSYMHIFNTLNKGENNGTFVHEVFDIIDQNGVIPMSLFNPKNTREWPSGLNIYKEGMPYQVANVYKLNPKYDDEFNAIKKYLHNHNDGREQGGLIQFSAFADPLDPTSYNGPSESNYTAIIPLFGNDGMHSMTIVGYDDSVEWDFNKDGDITEDEKGAFICVNSWGIGWGDKGRFYVPYKTFRTLPESKVGGPIKDAQGNYVGGGTGNGTKDCFIVKPCFKKVKMAIRLGLKHNSRNDIKVKYLAANKNDDNPSGFKVFKPLTQCGGDYNMRGKNNEVSKSIEFGIDVTGLDENLDENTIIYLKIFDVKTGKELGEGEILYCNLVDYTGEKPVEYSGQVLDGVLKRNSFTTISLQTIPTPLNDNDGTDFMGCDVSCACKSITLITNVKHTTKVEVELLDEEGVSLNTLFAGDIEPGKLIKTIDAKNYEPGNYFVRLISGNQVVIKKIEIK